VFSAASSPRNPYWLVEKSPKRSGLANYDRELTNPVSLELLLPLPVERELSPELQPKNMKFDEKEVSTDAWNGQFAEEDCFSMLIIGSHKYLCHLSAWGILSRVKNGRVTIPEKL
jgi:hypothetical protein